MKTPLNIHIAQIKPLPMNITQNVERMKLSIQKAKANNADVIVFPELIVSGYLLGDRFEYVDFVTELQIANETLRELSDGIVVVWGNIVLDTSKIGEDGRVRKYNAACIAHNKQYVSNGVLDGFIPKNNLPKYRIFDDARHFYPAYKLAQEMKVSPEEFFRPFTVTVKGYEYKLALSVCEDLWENEYQYKISKYYKAHSVDVLIDISASPWTLSKWHARETMLVQRVKDVGAPILYVNCVGLQNNGKNLVWFDGASVLVNRDGAFAYRASTNIEVDETITLDESGSDVKRETTNTTEELYNAITKAMKEFYQDLGTVVIGLSGGIDSALTLALLREAFPAQKILTVNMPTHYNSGTTQRLAKKCADNFGVKYLTIPIESLYIEQVKLLESTLERPLVMITKENIQARIRGQQLAAIAGDIRGVFTNNGNKTEIALNYFTLYGDGAGAAAFLGDLWKGQIYDLARYCNQKASKELIPEEMITLIPSAELSDEQNVDEGKGDPIYYPYHDKLLQAFVEKRIGNTEILALYTKGELDQ
jgi:NAD+ synthase (glutamine-hydrolysing)